ncbi:MAG: DUF1684 domain-containing protein [Acidobacteria bacterium]|nr:DUF1684 domain-containing protein [Acidobacteriota bacterium]MYJ05541.1 DUF1684 domain-containing protein [Acidobacteriota bacterium]
MLHRHFGRSVALGLAAAFLMTAGAGAQDYAAEIEAWRVDREARLAADDGWLTVAGLFFLNEGTQTFGSSPLNDILLRTGPEQAGTFTLRNNVVTVRAAEGTTLNVDGRDVTEARLWPYEGNDRPTIALGPLSLFGHYSGDRLAIRMRDQESAIRQEFTGLRWYPVDDTFRVEGTFIPHDEPRAMELPNILGDVETFRTSGSVAMTVGGAEVRMTAVDSGGRLWFIFRDLTSGAETYPAARFLYADVPGANGTTTVDFNRAYNPPCAFNPHTTCPLPPLENRLPVRVEAGELDYHAP